MPSRLLNGALVALTVAACVSVLVSEAPPVMAGVAIAAVLVIGVRMLRKAARAPRRTVVIDGQGRVHVDGLCVDAPRLHWRGPLVRLDWHAAGRRHSLLWWPDTLPPSRRRELRLAPTAPTAPRAPESMAP